MKKLTTLLAIGMIISTVMPAVGQDKVNPPKSKKELVLKTAANAYTKKAQIGMVAIKVTGAAETRGKATIMLRNLNRLSPRDVSNFTQSIERIHQLRDNKIRQKMFVELIRQYGRVDLGDIGDKELDNVSIEFEVAIGPVSFIIRVEW